MLKNVSVTLLYWFHHDLILGLYLTIHTRKIIHHADNPRQYGTIEIHSVMGLQQTKLDMWDIPELRYKEQWKESLGLEALALSLQISIYHFIQTFMAVLIMDNY